ncbi:MAG TPA: hypothetical protein VGM90_11035 [Kofleriaceae bacterium]|jgi:hypothetical protein
MSADIPPAGLTWGAYVEQWVAECGGWLPLADQLIHRAGDSVEIGLDPQTVERGLRRLSRRHHKEGGQYGRWMLRFFGFTQSTEHWVKWMGIYHTRFADLAVGLRLQQLALWYRPPITEAPLACWLEVGTASAHYARLDLAACELWLGRAERHVASAGSEAQLEVGLIRAQLAVENGGTVDRLHATVEEVLRGATLPVNFAASYRARLQHQRAAVITRSAAPDFERVRALYADIPDSPVPFVRFRKSVGLAYCAWKAGDTAAAVRLAEEAVDAAGDGGLMRMRVMALNMLSRVLDGSRATAVNERAKRMAEALEDEDLLRRVAQSAP